MVVIIMAPSLPDDILHLICIQLWHQRDFNTLYSCARSSKQLAIPALANIYRWVYIKIWRRKAALCNALKLISTSECTI